MGYVSFLEGNYRDLIWGTPSITENLRFGAKIFHTEGVGGLVLHGSRSPRVDEVPLKKITFCIHLAVVVSMCYFLGRNGVHHNHRKSHEKNGDTAGFSNFWGLFQVIMANPVQRSCHTIDLQKVVILLGQVLLEDGIVFFWFRRIDPLDFTGFRTMTTTRGHGWVFCCHFRNFFWRLHGVGFPFVVPKAKVMNTNMATRPCGFVSGDVMLKESKHRNPLTNISVLGEQIGAFSSLQRMQHVFFNNFLI